LSGLIQQSVSLNHLGTATKDWECPIVFDQPARGLFCIIGGDGQDDAIVGFDCFTSLLQLTELPFAVRSPTAAAEKFDNDVFFASKIRQFVCFALGRFENKVGRPFTHFRRLSKYRTRGQQYDQQGGDSKYSRHRFPSPETLLEISQMKYSTRTDLRAQLDLLSTEAK
jgi:hypothetical protein